MPNQEAGGAGVGRAEALSGWAVSPAEYIEGRPAQNKFGASSSQYVEMSDGCRLAVDVYLPSPIDGSETDDTFATIAIFTPYYRRFKLKPGGSGEVNPNSSKYVDFFVPRGYAVVVIDVRGTGASFGTRDGFRSPRERDDTSEIADWIVSQTWSNGTIGATGISYLGASSDFLASTGHPAVKAVAPLFAVWDTYQDNYFPGGIYLNRLAEIYDDLLIALDHDQRHRLSRFAYFSNPDFAGPQPVDDDASEALLKSALKEHLGNFRQPEFMPEFKFREEGLPYDPTYSSASFSPYSYSQNVRPDVAVLSVSGWFDGAGYMNGAISRYLTLNQNPRYLLLGPWDHGGRVDGSPWRKTEEPEFPFLGEVLRLFDTYLLGMETGLEAESPIHYYSMHDETWCAADQWPPTTESVSFFTGSGGVLGVDSAPTASDVYDVDFTIGTGSNTRYERIAGIDTRIYYNDWQNRTDRMLNYTSEPLSQSMKIGGHVIVDLEIASSEPDAGIFVYLTEIMPDGREYYITEGLLRGLHRKEAGQSDTYRTTWPYRTFHRGDASPMPVNVAENVRIPLLPVGWRLQAGSRLRLSIAGADVDHCAQVPHGRPPKFTVFHGGDRPSALFVPVRS